MPNFQHLVHRLIHRVNQGDVAWGTDLIPEQNCALADFQQQKFQPKARDILISWARAREYRDGEAGYLQLARSACHPDVRDRFIAIAQHYRSLAKIEQSIADQRPNKKSRQSHLSS